MQLSLTSAGTKLNLFHRFVKLQSPAIVWSYSPHKQNHLYSCIIQKKFSALISYQSFEEHSRHRWFSGCTRSENVQCISSSAWLVAVICNCNLLERGAIWHDIRFVVISCSKATWETIKLSKLESKLTVRQIIHESKLWLQNVNDRM